MINKLFFLGFLLNFFLEISKFLLFFHFFFFCFACMEIEEDLESLVLEEEDLNEKEIELEDQPHNFKTNFKIYLEDLISLFS